MSEILKVGRKYTVTLKKNLRSALGIEEGQLLLAEVRGGILSLKPLPKKPFEELDNLLGNITEENLRESAEKFLMAEAEKALEKRL